MRKALGITFKILLVAVVVIWIGLIVVEYFRYQNDEPMIIVLKSETITYEDGRVYVNYGLGYKSITYSRSNITGKEFGHIFIPIREKVPNR